MFPLYKDKIRDYVTGNTNDRAVNLTYQLPTPLKDYLNITETIADCVLCLCCVGVLWSEVQTEKLNEKDISHLSRLKLSVFEVE